MNMLLRWVVRPYIRYELPRWGWVYARFVGSYRHDPLWAGEPTRVIRGKLHGYEMELNLSQWSERTTYFLGRFYDLGTQQFLLRFLRRGDRVIDVGANIGMISLLASRLVGPEGVVDAFEPNPRCAARIRSSVARNEIQNIRVHEVALTESDGVMPLTVPRYNSGEGTLTRVDEREFGPPEGTEVFEVPVRAGDQALVFDPRPPVLIKIDVEGYEHQVLSGLSQTLDEQKPLVLAEVIVTHLKRAGRTPKDLFDLMRSRGYEGRRIVPVRRGFRRALTLEPVDDPDPSGDVLWVPSTGPARQRLRQGGFS